jgi:protoporphyrinogen oxidase
VTLQLDIAILGAGPAGLAAAFELTRRGVAGVAVLEQNRWVGGNAGSFELAGTCVDYGSHRLHPACDPEVLRDIRAVLGDDLLDRRRHGRIFLRHRWIHFPLKPLDLAVRLPARFSTGVAADVVRRALPQRGALDEPETFASVLEAGLGRTICREFYFPYAQKIWGLAPEEMSATQARRRVSANSLAKMMQKALSALPVPGRQKGDHFYYPRHGFGQICEAYSQAAQAAGAGVHLDARVLSVEMAGKGLHTIYYEQGGSIRSLQAHHVWSTIPVTALARSLNPLPAPESLRAAESIRYRAMILIYLVLEQAQFSEYDAHYFPGADISITRLSEPKNYSGGQGPADRTVLCAELPCDAGGSEWASSDDELGHLVCDALATAGIPIRAPVSQVITRRLPYAYPIYRLGYEAPLERLERQIGEVDGLLTFGRQGLFAHDNTHHALYVGYCAARCLDESGLFDRRRWQALRRTFEAHVVED